MSTNPNQYFLLADHIKLSLLERQRAISLNLEPTSQDAHISRSLESLREGLENITNERIRLEEAGETSYVRSISSFQSGMGDNSGNSFHTIDLGATSAYHISLAQSTIHCDFAHN